jgi:hypothetical protein
MNSRSKNPKERFYIMQLVALMVCSMFVSISNQDNRISVMIIALISMVVLSAISILVYRMSTNIKRDI